MITVQPDFDLEIGNTYYWIFEVILDSGSGRSDNPSVSGLISRKEMTTDVESRLTSLEAADKLNLYFQDDLWHDALGELVKLERDMFENELPSRFWQTLLSQGGLTVLAEESLLDCCTAI